MTDKNPQTPDFDWRLTTFEGSRREQLRRWSQLPLEKILKALEEMEDFSRQIGPDPVARPQVKEDSAAYGKKARGGGVDPEKDK